MAYIPDILDSDKVEVHLSQKDFLKSLNSRWNGQYTNSQGGAFFQTNPYLNPLFQLKFLPYSKEKAEVKKDFRDMKDDMLLDTEILLKDGSITVYDITDVYVLYGGKVIVRLKNGRKEEVYTRNGIDRELFLVKNKSQINLTRPGIENYYRQNKEKYPGIRELNCCFQELPTPNMLPSRLSAYEKVAESIYERLNLTPKKMMSLLKEYRLFHRACGYQLCHEKYKSRD
ncbi:MAG: hypothetical protein K2M69_05145 [Muribaculaceae bacterium]|nr:hypothetical protein [Muribaculaceae bacterium]